MLHEFLSAHQNELIDRCRYKAAQRREPELEEAELEHGVPQFLAQLIRTLQIEQTGTPFESRAVSGPAGGDKAQSQSSEIGKTAAQHGRELSRQGFTVEQVVHDYGDLCQAITDLAVERESLVTIDEFRSLNRCLDNGIAVAVTEFTNERDFLDADRPPGEANERLAFFAHELRNRLHTAALAVAAMKAGQVGMAGATGAVLDRSLIGMRTLIDRSLAAVRITNGSPPQLRMFSLADFIAEVKVSASLEADARKCRFKVAAVDRRLAVRADRDLLLSAVGNLLQNAFRFTRPDTEVTLSAGATESRIQIDVTDSCGGLPPGDPERMFLPFTQPGSDKSGLGVGLSIARRTVEANAGTLSVRDLPGSGCMFSIDLPRP